MNSLAEAGFDATQGDSMRIIEKPLGSPAIEPERARDLLERMVYVPMYPELTISAVEKMAKTLLQFFQKHPNRKPLPPTEPEQPARSLTGVTSED